MSGSNGFTPPFPSSPPSTPGHYSANEKDYGSFTYADNPSTTPAGPPPSSTRSFTPAGPPPSSIFGSSHLGTGNIFAQSKSRLGSNLVFQKNVGGPDSQSSQPHKSPSNSLKTFGSKASHPYKESSTPKIDQVRKSPSRSTNTSGSKRVNPRRLSSTPFKKSPKKYNGARRSNTFAVPSSSLRSSSVNDVSSASDADIEAENERESGESEEDGGMEVDSEEDRFPRKNSMMDFEPEITYPSESVNQSRRGSSGNVQPGQKGQNERSRRHKSSRWREAHLGRKKDSVVPTLAKHLSDELGPSSLDEPDDLILETEELISELYKDNSTEQQNLIDTALSVVPEALCKLWQSCCNREKQASPRKGEFTIGIGPDEKESSLQKANFLSSLLLQLHHPPTASGKQALIGSRIGRSVFRTSSSHTAEPSEKSKPYPQILLEWLEAHHDPYITALANLHTYYPNSTANHNFWDLVYSSILRGKLSDVIKIFKEADFKHARTARDDGQTEDGYRGLQLDNTTIAVNGAIRLLESCPAVTDGNWDITGNDWIVFRKRIEQAMSNLASLAEGRDKDLDPIKPNFEAEHFGIRGTASALTKSARKAESMVPWTIYQNLKALYGVMLGGAAEIISFAQDWVEATVGLTVWWDGSDNDDEVAIGDLVTSRRSLRKSPSQMPRSVDVETKAAYLHRLAYAFEKVTDDLDEESFQINPSNPIEVGLASIFEGNIKGVIDLLKKWSMTITSAIVEVAARGDWLGLLTEPTFNGAFNASDLMVLSYHQPNKGLTKDAILVEYADMLFEKESLEDVKAEVIREGWEISMGVLLRLDDTLSADKHVQELLDKLTLQSDSRADKMIFICRAFGLDAKAAEISEVLLSDLV